MKTHEDKKQSLNNKCVLTFMLLRSLAPLKHTMNIVSNSMTIVAEELHTL
ncbi:hypothetical protein SAMN04487941_0086 [Pontibacter akesuensis]|uniref:Uncharacterized protein n=1 Tax=Pontibacter akesuensis TaxID=388950 RepID=A0A1I7KXZ8_9BACT|nr:hypothetical protein SAMN04487941_0086 [Pontibacter akesuensis]